MKYKINKADLWGNPNEGYEVNDWYGSHTIEMDIDLNTITDSDLVKALVSADYFNDFILTDNYTYECDYESYADSKIVYLTLHSSLNLTQELFRIEQLN